MRRVFMAVAVMVFMMAGVVTGALAAPGTIKISGVAIDDIPNNAPHQGCVFYIEASGFTDEDQGTATVRFFAQDPSGSGQLGQDLLLMLAPETTSTQFDLSQYTDQLFLQPNQGYHISVDVAVNGENPKQKTFWVEGCEPPAPTPTNTPMPTNTPEPTPTNTPEPTATPTEEVTPTPTEEVTPTPTEEVTPTPTTEVTPTPTGEVTSTPTEEVTPTPKPDKTPKVEPTATATVPVAQLPSTGAGDGGASGGVMAALLAAAGIVLAAGAYLAHRTQRA